MSDAELKVIESADLKGIVSSATKVVLDNVEASVLGALAAINATVTGCSDHERQSIEASIYEEVALVCSQRIVQIAIELKEDGDESRADLIHLSLAAGLREVGLRTGEADESTEN